MKRAAVIFYVVAVVSGERMHYFTNYGSMSDDWLKAKRFYTEAEARAYSAAVRIDVMELSA